jgi:hypothetical protein
MSCFVLLAGLFYFTIDLKAEKLHLYNSPEKNGGDKSLQVLYILKVSEAGFCGVAFPADKQR